MNTPSPVFQPLLQEMVAPCGINCSRCKAHLRENKPCAGCNVDSDQKPKHCFRCTIKLCNERRENARFCFECPKYPCVTLRHIDKRYRTRYSVGLIANLEEIRESGLAGYLETEKLREACSNCGGIVCIHDRKCYTCGTVNI